MKANHINEGRPCKELPDQTELSFGNIYTDAHKNYLKLI
jgi:hypothetical protein